ncbi:hypothetical protein [Sphingomonas sp.]|jgi:hypothetical protein|uniref:hypothetical protein n=1 Tax=Sphingomonas sp. TaxID=28214 RepID=UPI0039C9D12C
MAWISSSILRWSATFVPFLLVQHHLRKRDRHHGENQREHRRRRVAKRQQEPAAAEQQYADQRYGVAGDIGADVGNAAAKRVQLLAQSRFTHRCPTGVAPGCSNLC